ncbi:ead/Ea22-like family protein [Pseudomonas aeruginosa]|uniref:ead/Ea22-like family protein n=1 Tax=Pseudomonas aeruginosa TaxID=287 RepID=UPI000EB5F61C|nr:ead/Ea22-like family protein [Pseudomonas aeruginosa]
MTDHAELRRLAKAATPGARYQGTDERVIVAGNGTIICTVSGAISGPSVMADAEFLCATDPNTILALLDEIDRLRSRLEIDERTPHDGIACRDETIKVLDEKCDRLKAENETLREALFQISSASCSDARSVVIARTALTKGATK